MHASDGGRCHPSIRGDIYEVLVQYLYVCSYVRHIYSIVLYCYVSTLAPLYVRPLNQPTKIILLNDNRRLDRGCATRHPRLLQEAHQQATGPENARYSLNKERDSQGNS